MDFVVFGLIIVVFYFVPYNAYTCMYIITQYGSTVYIGIAMVYPH